MQQNILADMVAVASGSKPQGSSYRFKEKQGAAVLVGTASELLSIEPVQSIELRDGYVAVQTATKQQFLIGYDAILGVSLRTDKHGGGAGFV